MNRVDWTLDFEITGEERETALNNAAEILAEWGLTMPPARFGLSVFNVLGVILLLMALQARRDECPQRFFTTDLRIYWLPILLLLPSVFIAINVQRAAIEWLLLWGYYAVVLVGRGVFSDQRNVDRTHALLAISLAVISLCILLQKLTGISFGFLYQERELVASAGTFVKQGSGPVSYTHLTLPTNREV